MEMRANQFARILDDSARDLLAPIQRVPECRDPISEVGRLLCLERDLTPAEWAFINSAEMADAEEQAA